MKIKMILITLFACMLLALSVRAHVPGYQVTAVSGTLPTIDGIINPTHDPDEWADASVVNFDGIIVYVKHYDWNGLTQLYVAFRVPDTTYDENDKVMVSIDGWHDDGSPPNAPKWEDDVRCILTRASVGFEEQGSNPPGNWVPTLIEEHCGGVAQDFGAMGYWEAEFEINYDNQMLIPHQTNGFMLKSFDTSIGKYSWPSSPNGDDLDLSTWGDLLWPEAPGTLTAQIGENSPGDHGWYYDPDADPYNEMLQISLTASTEDVILNSFTLRAGGTGNDATDVDTVYIFWDQNNNGRFDSGEPAIGSGSYTVDNGQLTISVSHTVPAGSTRYFVIAYTMNMNAPIGRTFWFTLNSISATGASSGQPITVTGLPITSAVKTITASLTSVKLGSSNPGDHTWYYDPQADPYNEMLQFDFTATNGADVQINSITLEASGTGDDKNDISKVDFVLDANNNGIYDTGDTLLANGSYASDDGTLWLSLGTNPYIVSAGTTAHFLIAYEMTSSSSPGDTFKVQITSINAINVNTSVQETVNGLPLTSGTKTTVSTLPPPTACSGILSLTLAPDIAEASDIISAALTGLVSCGGKTASVRWYSCQGAVVCTASIEGTAGYCAFTAPAFEGRYLLYGCIDMNGDGDFRDFGEQAYDVLNVESEEESCVSTNCGGCVNESSCANAGCHWCDSICQPDACPGEEGPPEEVPPEEGPPEAAPPSDWTPYIILIAIVILIGFAMLAYVLYSTRKPKVPKRGK